MKQTYAIIGLVIYFVILLFAVTREKKNNNAFDFFFAGRNVPFWALSITFVASWWGAGSALSTADLAYAEGMGSFWYYGVPVLFSAFIMIIASKAIRRIDFLTQGEMMTARYLKLSAKMLSIMILILMIFNAASQMVDIGQVFSTYLNIPYTFAIAVGIFIVLIYSFFGGFRAVVLTDLIQFVFLLISALLVFGFAMKSAGGFEGIRQAADAANKVGYMDVMNGIKKNFIFVITFGFSWMIQANVWQRLSAARDDNDARKMAIMSFFLYIPLYLIVVFTGMADLALYKTIPDGDIITAVVNDYMPLFLSVIVFVGIAAAIMSSMDSLINTGAMTMILDLGFMKKKTTSIKASKIAIIIVTIIAFVIAVQIRSILTISWIASDVITTGMFVPLVLGFIWRRGNNKGALASIFFGLTYCLYNLLIEFKVSLPSFWEHNGVGQVIFGICMSFILYVGVSLMTKPEYEKADPFIKKVGLFRK